MITLSKSAELFEFARRFIPGGVNTSIRRVEPDLVWTKAQGAYIWDADGNRYIDYHAAFGPLILGHCHPKVNQRVFETLQKIDLLGTGTTELEAKLAEKICQHVPCAQRVLFCNSGSEATYHAVRLARAVTGRRKLIKFQGCYHGYHDYLAMNVINTAEQIGTQARGPYPNVPLSAGSLKEAIESTIVLTFNRLDEVEGTVKKERDIAAIILEPIPHNIGCVLPKPEFLQGLRRLCDEQGIVLIFDEVITGFRHHIGGYQAVCGVTPDLTSLGKAIANGYPCAALCGKAELMDRFNTAPSGDVLFAGTFNGHAMAMAAALATIEELESGEVHRHIFRLGEKIRKGLTDIIERLGIKATVAGFGSVWLIYFLEPPIENYTDLLRNDAERFVRYRLKMLERGIFELPMNLKRNHISAAHTDDDIDLTLEAAEVALKEVCDGA